MAADWWSVGVMIFEMLGGLPTFRGKDLRQTYQKVAHPIIHPIIPLDIIQHHTT